MVLEVTNPLQSPSQLLIFARLKPPCLMLLYMCCIFSLVHGCGWEQNLCAKSGLSMVRFVLFLEGRPLQLLAFRNSFHLTFMTLISCN